MRYKVPKEAKKTENGQKDQKRPKQKHENRGIIATECEKMTTKTNNEFFFQNQVTKHQKNVKTKGPKIQKSQKFEILVLPRDDGE